MTLSAPPADEAARARATTESAVVAPEAARLQAAMNAMQEAEEAVTQAVTQMGEPARPVPTDASS